MAGNREGWAGNVAALCVYWRREIHDDDDDFLKIVRLECIMKKGSLVVALYSIP